MVSIFFFCCRGNKTSEWDYLDSDLEWKEIVEPVMQLYTEATDGSYIEAKESALVWHHYDADPDFGSCQAKELLDHLESVLANEPAVVKRGQHIVEVKPQVSLSLVCVYFTNAAQACCKMLFQSFDFFIWLQGVTKGLVAAKVLSMMLDSGKPPDFVMCIGDDRSDEDMFESILSTVSSPLITVAPDIFACTVGQKPSKAKYYLDDTADVLRLLEGLVNASNPKPIDTAQSKVAFGSFSRMQIT